MNFLNNSHLLELNSPVIIALDFHEEKTVLDFVTQLSPDLCKLKVGLELFTACGPKLVEKLIMHGYDIFLDLKFHDIPNTVFQACKSAATLGVWMLNVHATGGAKMLEKAKEAMAHVMHPPLLIGVTLLTSTNQDDLTQMGIKENINDYVLKLAKLCKNANLDGIVCSALEAKIIKESIYQDSFSQEFLTVCPGIRLPDNNLTADDQSRIMTPKSAIANMADYLVIGRPITTATDPLATLLNILAQIKQ